MEAINNDRYKTNRGVGVYRWHNNIPTVIPPITLKIRIKGCLSKAKTFAGKVGVFQPF